MLGAAAVMVSLGQSVMMFAQAPWKDCYYYYWN
jgi:hypothetical protein